MTQKSLDTSGIILTSVMQWLLHSPVLAPVLALRSSYIITNVIYHFRTYLELKNFYCFEEHDLIFRCNGEEAYFFAVGSEFSCKI